MKTILSEKGQITIPKTLRDKLGLSVGSVLDFEEKKGILVARKVLPQDLLRKWRGKGQIPGGFSVDKYLDRARG